MNCIIIYFITALMSLRSVNSKKKQEYIVQYVSDSSCNLKNEIFAIYPLLTCTAIWTGSQPSVKHTSSPFVTTISPIIDQPSAHQTVLSTFIPTTTAHTSAPSTKPPILPNTLSTVTPSLKPISNSPTALPSFPTSSNPSILPISTPAPSANPTTLPSFKPTKIDPSAAPSANPSSTPSTTPSLKPVTKVPTIAPTSAPSPAPSATLTTVPSLDPSATPSANPSSTHSTTVPSAEPSSQSFTSFLTAAPTSAPSSNPSILPTIDPTNDPSTHPTTSISSSYPSDTTTVVPSFDPSNDPSTHPTTVPSTTPSSHSITNFPTAAPTSAPSYAPSANPTIVPSFDPTNEPLMTPSAYPSSTHPTTVPLETPSSPPITDFPTVAPTSAPSLNPSISSTSSPAVSNNQKICQNSGYCRTDSDCVPGNKCNVHNAYYSQCLADSSTYLTSNCVSNNGHCADSSAVCCDPGSYCTSAGYSQCVQPTAASGKCLSPPYFPSISPTISPTVSPTISIAPTGSPKICQNGGYCLTNSDCVPGNKCIVHNAYSSQCQADSSTYLTSNCVSNFGHCADHTAVCCDPGSHCSIAGYSQCVQPSPPACTNPNGFSLAAVAGLAFVNPYDLKTNAIDEQARTARIEMAVGVDNSYKLRLAYYQDSSCAIRSAVESAEVVEGSWCTSYNGMPKLLSVYEHSVPQYHGIVMQLFASTSSDIDTPVSSALVEPIATMVKHPMFTCQPYSHPSTPTFKSSSLRRCWMQGKKIYAAWKFYYSSGCKGVSEFVPSKIVGPTTTQYDVQSQTSYYLACV